MTASELGLPPFWTNVGKQSIFEMNWLPTNTTIDAVQLRVSTKVNHGYLKVEYKLNDEVIGAQEWGTFELPDQVKNVTYTVTSQMLRGRNLLDINASGLAGVSWRTAYLTIDLLITYSGTDPTTTKPADKTDIWQWLATNGGNTLVILLAVGLVSYAVYKILRAKANIKWW